VAVLFAVSTTPSVETDPVPSSGTAADDPAIWVHPTDPSQSVVIGTDKQSGLGVYDLAGAELQFLSDGQLNNVDVRYNFPLGADRVGLVVSADQADDTLAIYTIDPTTRALTNVEAGTITTGIAVDGLCLYHSPTSGNYYAFVTSSTGDVEQWELFDNGSGLVTASLARSFNVGGAVEGCVADDQQSYFFVSEEAVGIWRYDAEPTGGSTATQVDVLTGSGGDLTADVEGLTIYYGSSGDGYLIASCQGASTFNVYDRQSPHNFIDFFTIDADVSVDAATDTEGIDVVNGALGVAFPFGAFVAQDGLNDVGNQNFKIVAWDTIAGAFTPALTIDTTFDVRDVGARVSSGLLALYTFNEGSGSVVEDVSGVNPPLDLDIQNTANVTWLPGALRFDTSTKAWSAGPATKIISAAMASNEITVEVWVKTSTLANTQGRVTSISPSTSRRNVTVDQYSAEWRGLARISNNHLNGLPQLLTTGSQVETVLQHVVWTRAVDGVKRLYVDGVQRATATLTGDFSNWDTSYRILVGNETNNSKAFLGEVHLVAYYDRALDGLEVTQNYIAGSAGGAAPPEAPEVLTFAASPDTIVETASSTLSWTTQNATSVSIDNGVGSVALNGNTSVSPSATTVYTITATGPGGSDNATATVTVQPPVPPTIDTYTATPVDTIPVKLMALGDSITQANSTHNSYRRPLWQTIDSAGYNVDFVGTLTSNFGGANPNPDFDLDHEGHWGWRADEILAQISTWAAATDPDKVLLHIGTNDLFQNQTPASTITEIEDIIDDLRVVNPDVEVFLAQIIPAGTSETVSGTSTLLNDVIDTFNALIPGLVATLTTAQSPVHVVDQHTGFDGDADTYDGIHPDAGGEAKMAAVWFAAIEPCLIIESDPDTWQLDWETSDADSASIDQGIGSVAVDGDVLVAPTVTTTYELTATGPGGSATDTVTVTIGAPPPVIDSFTATPASITIGNSSLLAWQTTDADTVSIDQGVGNVPLDGTQSVSPTVDTTYTITASGPGGVAQQTVDVTVLPLPPVIDSFTASPTTINEGQQSTLTWATTGAVTVFIDGGVGNVSEDGSTNVSPTTTTLYTLTATNPGGAVIDTATVTVNPAPTPPSFLAHPANATVTEGQTATFSVTVQGTAPLSYQWQLDDGTSPGTFTNIGGAIGASYTTPTTILADSGNQYRCVVTNAGGDATSNPATLTVNVIGSRITAGLQMLYTFQEGAGSTVADVSGVGAPVNLTIDDLNDVTWIPGALSVDAQSVLTSATLPTKLVDAVQLSHEVTIEAWVKPANLTTGQGRIVTLAPYLSERNFALDLRSDVYTTMLRTTDTSNDGTPSVSTGAYAQVGLQHIVVTRNSANTFRIYIDSVVVHQSNITGDMTNWNDTYPIAVANTIGANIRSFLGELHLIALYSRALTPGEVQQNTIAGPIGSSPAPPTVDSFTADDASISAGGSTTLHWTTSNSSLVEISPGSGFVTPDGSLVVSPTFTTTYTIFAYGSGAPDTETITVAVEGQGLPAGFNESLVISGLDLPTAAVYAPDGRVFVAEKAGLIKVFDSLDDTTPTEFVDLSGQLWSFHDHGLVAMDLDPDYPAQPYLYVAYPMRGSPSGRVSRMQIDLSTNTMSGSEQVLLEGWDFVSPGHSVTALRFGPDGALYVATGDGANSGYTDWGQQEPYNTDGHPDGPLGGNDPAFEGGTMRAQDFETTGDPLGFNGSILRMDPDTGLPMPDNPLIGGDTEDDYHIAYGLRMPYRIEFHPVTGEIWEAEVGWNDFEEINRLAVPTTGPIPNYGWPCYEGIGIQSSYDSANLPVCEALYLAGTTAPPFYAYPHNGGQSVTGIAFPYNNNWPAAYSGAMLFGDYSQGWINVMYPDVNGVPDPSNIQTFKGSDAFVVDLQFGPDGALYYIDFLAGDIRRVEYLGSNTAPIADLQATPTSGDAPLTVNFDASGSSDPDAGDTITFDWDLDADGSFGDSSAATPQYIYNTPGNYLVRLKVTDNHGVPTTVSQLILVDNSPPVATIDTPLSTFEWQTGQTIAFSGSGFDPDTGAMPPSTMSWRVLLHHCDYDNPTDCHQHVEYQVSGVDTDSVLGPVHEYPSFLEIELTVTEPGTNGLSDTTSVTIQPDIVTVTMATVPPGLELLFTTDQRPTPFTREAIVDGPVTISALSPQEMGGTTYVFDSWSDTGTATHNVTIPSTDVTYTATYVAVPPPPTVDSFTASPTTINQGESTTLAWTTTGASNVTIDNGVGTGAGDGNTIVSPATTTTYTLTVTNTAGSDNATVTVNVIEPPVVTGHPVSQTIAEGATATFTVVASGTAPFTYQWQEDSVNIPGATSDSYTTDPVTAGDDGKMYRCLVSNSAGSDFSDPATLMISAGSSRVTDALQALYTFEEGGGDTVYDVSGVGSPLDLTLRFPANVVWGSGTMSFPTNNKASSSGPATKIINACQATNEVTLEAWVTPDTLATSLGRLVSVSGATNIRNATIDQRLSHYWGLVRISNNHLNGLPLVEATNDAATTLQHVVFTRDVSGVKRLFVDGVEETTATLVGNFSNWDPNFPLYIGNESNNSKAFIGTFHLAAIYSKALTPTEVNQNFAAGADGNTAPAPPTIDSFTATPTSIFEGATSDLAWTTTNANNVVISPAPGTVAVDGSTTVSPTTTTTYTLTATGPGGSVQSTVDVTVTPPPPPPTIQSFTALPTTITLGDSTTLDWTVVDADTVTLNEGIGVVAHSRDMVLSPTTTTTYTLTATNAGGSVDQSILIIVELPPPTIDSFTATPGTITEGDSSTLAWTTTDATSVTIDQGVGSVAVDGNTSVSPAVTTLYTLTATNLGGSTQASVTVTVNPLPPPVIDTFTATPETITQGDSSTLAWTTTDATSVTIDQGVGSVAVDGTTSVSPAVTTLYTLTATNLGGSTQASVTVTVNPLPPPVIDTFTATPGTITQGDSSTLAWTTTDATSVTIDQGVGSAAVDGNTDVSPLTTTTYTLTATGPGGLVQATVDVTVNPLPPPVIDSFTATPDTITLGNSSTLAWTTTGATSTTIDQSVGSVAVDGNTSVSPAVTTLYTLTASNLGGSTQASVTVTVNAPLAAPNITQQPVDTDVLVGETATFTVAATGNPAPTFQWLLGGVPIGGATSDSYTTPATLLGNDGDLYSCEVSNSEGAVVSDTATLGVSEGSPRVSTDLVALYTFNEGGGDTLFDTSGFGTPLDLTLRFPGDAVWGTGTMTFPTNNKATSSGPATKIINACQATNEITLEAWITPASLSTFLGRLVSVSGATNIRNATIDQRQGHYWGLVRISNNHLNGLPLVQATNAVATTLQHVVWTRDVSGVKRLYVDGVEVISATLVGDFSNWDPNFPLYIGNEQNNSKAFTGTFHLAAIYSRALTDVEVTQNFTAGPE
jgi:myo-inositol-hexaphosphate 3-phosphohydrolase/glucose/arabinose dehydrogenase/lysophospholipase L1-like esterase